MGVWNFFNRLIVCSFEVAFSCYIVNIGYYIVKFFWNSFLCTGDTDTKTRTIVQQRFLQVISVVVLFGIGVCVFEIVSDKWIYFDPSEDSVDINGCLYALAKNANTVPRKITAAAIYFLCFFPTVWTIKGIKNINKHNYILDILKNCPKKHRWDIILWNRRKIIKFVDNTRYITADEAVKGLIEVINYEKFDFFYFFRYFDPTLQEILVGSVCQNTDTCDFIKSNASKSARELIDNEHYPMFEQIISRDREKLKQFINTIWRDLNNITLD